MSGGIGIFLLLVILVVAIGVGVFFAGTRIGLWNKETSPNSEDPEANDRAGRGERPEHTRVTDPADQTYVGD